MKTVYKFLALALVMFAFAATSTVTTFAQDPQAEKEALYQKFLANRKGPELEKRKTAIAAGKEYLQKFEATDGAEDQVIAYIKKQLPVIEKGVAGEELFARFNTSVPAKNWNETFATGKQIISENPDFIDVMLVLASVGFDNAAANPPVNTYNADAVNYAKMAIQKINEGKTSETYGAFGYTYKTKDYPDGKNNALGWMNYTIGYIMYYRQAQKKEALPYLYKATQVNSATQKFSDIYRAIGAWYVEETARLEKDRQAKIAAANNEATDETRAIFALQKGYTDRAIDAYSRAYKIANENQTTTTKEYRDGLYNVLKELYTFRFDGKTDGIDAYIAGVMSRPMPDPTTAVTPVAETPAATTTGATTPMTMPTTNVAPAANTRPATTNTATTVKPAATATSSTVNTTATKAATKPATAKKPVAKKKGTR